MMARAMGFGVRGWTLFLAVFVQGACGSGRGTELEPVGAIYFTGEGAESLSPYEMDRVVAAVEAVLEELDLRGIERDEEAEGALRTFRGRDEGTGLDVSVRLEMRDPSSTHLAVTALRGRAVVDQGYARRLLKKILELAARAESRRRSEN